MGLVLTLVFEHVFEVLTAQTCPRACILGVYESGHLGQHTSLVISFPAELEYMHV